MTTDFIQEAIATLLEEGYTQEDVAREIELGRLAETYREITLS
jgi:hypothetical protein